MSVVDEYRKPLPEKILKEIEFRYGASLLDGFDITDVRYSTVDEKGNPAFNIVLKLEKKK